MAVRPSLPPISITLQKQRQQQQQHLYSVSTLAYQKQSVSFKLREMLVPSLNRYILSCCMITKVTLQLRAPADEVAWKFSSLDSFALFTRSLFKVSFNAVTISKN